MGPVLLGLQFGSAAGHLAQRALGQYALPMPWPGTERAPGRARERRRAFAEDWSLPADETRLWVCVRELTAHAVLTRPHVARRIAELLASAAREAGGRPAGPRRAVGAEAGDPEALQHLLAIPRPSWPTC